MANLKNNFKSKKLHFLSLAFEQAKINSSSPQVKKRFREIGLEINADTSTTLTVETSGVASGASIEEGQVFNDITPIRSTTGAGDVTFSGNTTTSGNAAISGNVSIADSKFLNIGAGPDLQIYHNATDSFIENNTGELFVQGDNITVRSDTGTETFLTMDVNDGVDIFHNNVKKFETTSAGATVTGALTVSSTIAGTNIGNITARNLFTTTSTATPDNSAGADGDFYLIHDA